MASLLDDRRILIAGGLAAAVWWLSRRAVPSSASAPVVGADTARLSTQSTAAAVATSPAVVTIADVGGESAPSYLRELVGQDSAALSATILRVQGQVQQLDQMRAGGSVDEGFYHERQALLAKAQQLLSRLGSTPLVATWPSATASEPVLTTQAAQVQAQVAVADPCTSRASDWPSPLGVNADLVGLTMTQLEAAKLDVVRTVRQTVPMWNPLRPDFDVGAPQAARDRYWIAESLRRSLAGRGCA